LSVRAASQCPLCSKRTEELHCRLVWRNRDGVTSVDVMTEEERCVWFPLSFARCCRLLLRRRRVNPATDSPAILLTALVAPTSRQKVGTSRKATPAHSRPLRAVHLRKARKGNHPPACRQLPKDPPRRSLIRLRRGVDQRFVPVGRH